MKMEHNPERQKLAQKTKGLHSSKIKLITNSWQLTACFHPAMHCIRPEDHWWLIVTHHQTSVAQSLQPANAIYRFGQLLISSWSLYLVNAHTLIQPKSRCLPTILFPFFFVETLRQLFVRALPHCPQSIRPDHFLLLTPVKTFLRRKRPFDPQLG